MRKVHSTHHTFQSLCPSQDERKILGRKCRKKWALEFCSRPFARTLKLDYFKQKLQHNYIH